MLGHRAEKCRKNNGYEEALVRKYETSLRSSLKIRDFDYLYEYTEEIRDGLQAG